MAEAEGFAKHTAENESDAMGEVFANATRAALKKSLTEITIVVGELKSENAFLKKLIAELKDGIDFLGDGITDLKEEMCDLKNELGDLKSQMGDLKSQMADLKNEPEIADLKNGPEMADLKNEIPDPALAFIPRVLEVRKLAQNLEPSAVEAHEARKTALKLKADNKRAMLEGDGCTWLVEEI